MRKRHRNENTKVGSFKRSFSGNGFVRSGLEPKPGGNETCGPPRNSELRGRPSGDWRSGVERAIGGFGGTGQRAIPDDARRQSRDSADAGSGFAGGGP